MMQIFTPDSPRSADVQPPQAQEQPQTEYPTDLPLSGGASSALPSRPRRLREPWLALSALVALGGVSGISYFLGFVEPYQLLVYYTTPLLDLAKINGHTGLSANEWAFTWIVLFACYYAAFRICPPAEGITPLFRRFALVMICGWAVFFAVNLLFMYPVGAADLFDQIFRARLTAHYGYNPFTTLPSSIVGDPLQQYVAWKGDPSPYGPVWESLAAGVSWLAGRDLLGNLIGFKLLVMAAYGISIGLTYGILRTIKPEWALRGTLLFAWNPLVLFEVAGNGHNDAIMAMFLLAAIYFLVKAWRVAVLPALMAGILTKFVPLLLLPVALCSLWRDRSRPKALSTLAVGAVLAVGLATIFYAPFWTGPDSLLPRNRDTLFTASISKVALDTLTMDFGWGQAIAEWWVRNIAYGIVALVAAGLAVWVLQTPNTNTPKGRAQLLQRTLIAFYEIIFAYLLLASLWFQPWYLLWLVALTAPVARIENVNRMLLFCIGGVLNYFVWDFVWLWSRTEFRTIQITSAIAVYTLPVLYTLYVWTIGRRTTPISSR